MIRILAGATIGVNRRPDASFGMVRDRYFYRIRRTVSCGQDRRQDSDSILIRTAAFTITTIHTRADGTIIMGRRRNARTYGMARRRAPCRSRPMAHLVPARPAMGDRNMDSLSADVNATMDILEADDPNPAGQMRCGRGKQARTVRS